MFDKNEYLKSIQEKLKAEEKEIELGLSRFREATNSIEYKTALQAIAALKEPEAVKKGMELLTDKQEDTTVRILILQKALSGIGKSTEYIKACLSIAEDNSEQIELRRAVLSVLRALSFSSRIFMSLRPEYMTMLRSLLDDPDSVLREGAAEDLAKEKDEYVQRRLIDGLTGRETPIVRTAKAIQLLGYDIHAEHYPVLRRILQDPASDETTKREAVLVLANDVESKDLLTELMMDQAQPIEIRKSSATALTTCNPEYFTDIAKSLILNEKEDKDLREVCLNALMHSSDVDALYYDDDFLHKITTLQSSTTSPGLKQLSTKFLGNAMKQKRKS
jgi:HEAT repeat protein